ncbi:MAG: hypothetical protein U1E53_11155 [Dongiaceae bacterium]
MRAASPLALLPGALPLLLSLAAVAAEPDCRYRVTLEGAEAGALRVALRCAADGIGGFTIDPAARPFVQDFRIDGRTAVLTDGQWPVPASDRDATEVSYRLDLDGFAATADDADAARRSGGAVIAGLSALLARPLAPRRLAIAFEPGAAAVATALPATDGTSASTARRCPRPAPSCSDRAPYAAASGRGRRHGDPGAAIPPPASAPRRTIWPAGSATPRRRSPPTGAAPAASASLVLLPVPGARGLPFGRVVSTGGISILVLLGAESDAAALYDEWVLVHELIHLGSPYIRDTGPWLNEGLATYIEPIVRARAGWRSTESVWQEWLQNMPRGLEAMGPGGLRRADRRGIYWGGALFWLSADIAIRQASGGRSGLEDCLRAVLHGGGDVAEVSTTMAMLAACDAAVGGSVTRDLAAQHLDGGAAFDLPALWRSLGVALTADGRVVTDDRAPLAAVRRAIVAGRAPPAHAAGNAAAGPVTFASPGGAGLSGVARAFYLTGTASTQTRRPR